MHWAVVYQLVGPFDEVISTCQRLQHIVVTFSRTKIFVFLNSVRFADHEFCVSVIVVLFRRKSDENRLFLNFSTCLEVCCIGILHSVNSEHALQNWACVKFLSMFS